MIWERIAVSPPIDFGALRIDPRERKASMAGRPVELSPLLFRLLLLLAARPGSLVTRAELKLALWPYAVRIDTERRLNTAMRALRAALGDDADAPRFIATVRGEGYRWVAEPEPRLRPQPTALAACAAMALLLIGPAARPSPEAPLADLGPAIYAQAAFDEWRQAPSAQSYARAAAAVAAPGSETAALEVVRAELAVGGRWDIRSGEAHYRNALALDPANADARLGLAWLHANRGEREAALELVRELLASSLLTDARRANLGWLLMRLDRADLAASACAGGGGVNLLSCAHFALAALGRMDDAREVALALMRRLDADARTIEGIEQAEAAQGYAQFLDWRTRQFLPADAPWFERAQVLADAGRKEAALDAIARAVAAREPQAVKIASTPSFAALRSEPRFRRLASAVGV